MRYKCADMGSLRCPCILMEAGQCYTCTVTRNGKCDCSADWQGVCPYNEFLQRGKTAAKKGLPPESDAEVLSVKRYSGQLFTVRLGVSKGFAQRCRYAGSFITVSALGCRVPLSVLCTGWSNTQEGQETAWIEMAIQPAGPKTMELMRLSEETLEEEKRIWKIAGPFETGLLNTERLVYGEPVTVIAKGTAIAPFINIKGRITESAPVKVLADAEKLTEDFIRDHIEAGEGRCSLEMVNLAEEEQKVLASVDEATQIMLLASPYYTERFLGMRPGRKNDIITANHANMCCGGGICGSCSYTDKDGVTVRRCKCTSVV